MGPIQLPRSFRKPQGSQLSTGKSKAALVDNFIPEYFSFLSGESLDLVMTPWPRRMPGYARYRWPLASAAQFDSAWPTTLRRSLFERRAIKQEMAPAEIQLITSDWLARKYLERMPSSIEHVFVVQHLLPTLWQEGFLKDRTFDVLQTRLPWMERKLRLAEAGLSDYEVPEETLLAESAALNAANRVITPHSDYAGLFENVRKLEWASPVLVTPPQVHQANYILFPSTLRARHGALTALNAARAIGLPLLVVGGDPESIARPIDDVHFTTANEIPWHEVAAVVHPTLFEAWPRLHLQAVALDIPVIATPACGLEEGNGVYHVQFDDEVAIVRALSRALARDIDHMREDLKALETRPSELRAGRDMLASLGSALEPVMTEIAEEAAANSADEPRQTSREPEHSI